MDEDETSYRWETEYERTWETIQEDDSGTLRAVVEDGGERAKRRRTDAQQRIRMGMVRIVTYAITYLSVCHVVMAVYLLVCLTGLGIPGLPRFMRVKVWSPEAIFGLF